MGQVNQAVGVAVGLMVDRGSEQVSVVLILMKLDNK